MTRPDQTVEQAPKRMNPKHLRQTIYWLTLDWIYLRSTLPTPPHNDNITRRTTTRSYGHPAEWASDKAAEIVDILTSWHDLLAEHRRETPPPNGAEQHRIVSAWKYLEPRCEQLVELIDYADLKELPDLHHRIRHTLGYTNPSYTLPVPCPSCDLRVMQRTVGMGRDYIACGNPDCTYVVHDDPEGHNYRWLIRVCLDTLIGAEN